MNLTQETASPSRVEAPQVPLLRTDLCADGCGRPALPGSVYASIDCRDRMNARIDALIWEQTA